MGFGRPKNGCDMKIVYLNAFCHTTVCSHGIRRFFSRTGFLCKALGIVVVLAGVWQYACFAQPGDPGRGRGGDSGRNRGGSPGAMPSGPGGMMGGPGGMMGRGAMPGGPGGMMGGPGGMMGRGAMPGGPGGMMGGPGGMMGRGAMPGGPGGMMGGLGGFSGMFPAAAPTSRRSSESVTSSTTTTLVPGFGETTTENRTVPKFGEYVEAKTTTSLATNAASQQEALQRQINDQAQQLMSRYDRDKNGAIEKATNEWNNIRIDTDTTDINRDGRITLDELRVSVGNQLRGGTAGAKIFTSYATTYEYLPEGMPPWFTGRDKDNDGQLTLFEYANGQPVTQGVVDEFEWLDLNNDGIATLKECYSAIKTKEDLERKQRAEQGIAQNDPRDRRNRDGGEGGSFVPSADRPSGDNGEARGGPTRAIRPGGDRESGRAGGRDSRDGGSGGRDSGRFNGSNRGTGFQGPGGR